MSVLARTYNKSVKENNYFDQRSFTDQYSVKNIRSSENKHAGQQHQKRPSTSCQKTYHSDKKSLDITQFQHTQNDDVNENQKKIIKLQDERIIADQSNMFDKMASNKSLLSNFDQERSFQQPKCQSKRLNDYVHQCAAKQLDDYRIPLQQLLERRAVTNKFKQIENDLDANLDRIKNGFKNLQGSDEEKKQDTRRKIKDTSSKTNLNIRDCLSQCTQHVGSSSILDSCINDKTRLTRKRSSISLAFRDNTQSVDNFTQTTIAPSQKDYKQKYRSMVDKVRTNELVYLELKKQNMKLSTDNLLLKDQLERSNHAHQLELNESVQFIYHMIRLQSLHNEQELQSSRNMVDVHNKSLQELKDKFVKENSHLIAQLEQYSQVESQIQEIEQLYMNSLSKVQEQVKQSKSTIHHIKQSIQNLIKVCECYREGQDIPLETLVQHRQQGSQMEESDLLSSVQDDDQIQCMTLKNVDNLDQIFKMLCWYLDQIAENQINNSFI